MALSEPSRSLPQSLRCSRDSLRSNDTSIVGTTAAFPAPPSRTQQSAVGPAKAPPMRGVAITATLTDTTNIGTTTRGRVAARGPGKQSSLDMRRAVARGLQPGPPRFPLAQGIKTRVPSKLLPPGTRAGSNNFGFKTLTSSGAGAPPQRRPSQMDTRLAHIPSLAVTEEEDDDDDDESLVHPAAHLDPSAPPNTMTPTSTAPSVDASASTNGVFHFHGPVLRPSRSEETEVAKSTLGPLVRSMDRYLSPVNRDDHGDFPESVVGSTVSANSSSPRMIPLALELASRQSAFPPDSKQYHTENFTSHTKPSDALSNGNIRRSPPPYSSFNQLAVTSGLLVASQMNGAQQEISPGQDRISIPPFARSPLVRSSTAPEFKFNQRAQDERLERNETKVRQGTLLRKKSASPMIVKGRPVISGPVANSFKVVESTSGDPTLTAIPIMPRPSIINDTSQASVPLRPSLLKRIFLSSVAVQRMRRSPKSASSSPRRGCNDIPYTRKRSSLAEGRVRAGLPVPNRLQFRDSNVRMRDENKVQEDDSKAKAGMRRTSRSPTAVRNYAEYRFPPSRAPLTSTPLKSALKSGQPSAGFGHAYHPSTASSKGPRFRNTLELLPTPIIEVEESNDELAGDDSQIKPLQATKPLQMSSSARERKRSLFSRRPVAPPEILPSPELVSPADCIRTIAPRVNLPFVSVDGHIAVRFSINTLLREVQDAIPEISFATAEEQKILMPSSPSPVEVTEDLHVPRNGDFRWSQMDESETEDDHHLQRRGRRRSSLLVVDSMKSESMSGVLVEIFRSKEHADVVFEMVDPRRPSMDVFRMDSKALTSPVRSIAPSIHFVESPTQLEDLSMQQDVPNVHSHVVNDESRMIATENRSTEDKSAVVLNFRPQQLTNPGSHAQKPSLGRLIPTQTPSDLSQVTGISIRQPALRLRSNRLPYLRHFPNSSSASSSSSSSSCSYASSSLSSHSIASQVESTSSKESLTPHPTSFSTEKLPQLPRRRRHTLNYLN